MDTCKVVKESFRLEKFARGLEKGSQKTECMGTQEATSLLSLLRAAKVSLKGLEYTTNIYFLVASNMREKHGNGIRNGLKANIQTS